MEHELFDQVTAELKVDEGVRSRPYSDKTGKTHVSTDGGKLTIGVGRNIEDRGLPEEIIEALLRIDILEAEKIAKRLFPDFESYSRNRRACLINLAFNLGLPRLLGFRKMIAAIRNGDWPLAAYEARRSKWFHQVQPERSGRVVRQLEFG